MLAVAALVTGLQGIRDVFFQNKPAASATAANEQCNRIALPAAMFCPENFLENEKKKESAAGQSISIVATTKSGDSIQPIRFYIEK